MSVGCKESAGRTLRFIPNKRSSSFPVSTVECTASAIMAELLVTAAATNLQLAIARLVAIAA